MADIKALAAKYNDYIVERRRYYHARPELTEHEAETTEAVVKDLEAMGLPVERFEGMYGCVATLEGATPGKTVLLRADIDALPVTERNDCEWRSQNEGVMHACGHDMHAAVLFGVLKTFAEAPDFRGTLFGLFQPGEECNPGGASLVLAEKPFEGYDVRAVVGEHVEPQLEVGTLGFRAGKYMAASDELRFRVRGTGGHGAMRKQLKDPVAAGAELLTRLIALNGEECVLSIGRVEAGGATNIVPDEIYMEGTLRTFDERERGIIHRRIEIIAADIDARHGVKTEVTIGRGYPCVVNDEILVKQATALAKAEKLKVEMLPLRTTAEDFGFYCKQYPSLFYRLGVGAAAGRPHTATFFPDEAAIGVGIAYMRKLALQLLEK
uniref:M20 metallopeptidase family protein n=1 Tax=Alistipes shahii TaxID=328814 RepID=UPI003FEF5FBD